MNAMNIINTDLTEFDFIPELNLEGKMNVLEPHPNDNCRLIPSRVQEPKHLKTKIYSKSTLMKHLFIVYLVVKFLRKLKNSVIFPKKILLQKLSVINDLTFFPKKRTQKISKINLAFLHFLTQINQSYLLLFLKKSAEKFPLFDEFPNFLKVWDAIQLLLIFFMVVVIPINVFLLKWIQQTSFLILDQKIIVASSLFFSFDLLMKFNRRILKKGVWIAKRKDIAKKYFKTNLIIDLFSGISLFLWNTVPVFSVVFLSKIWYFQKLTKLFKLAKNKYFGLSLMFFIETFQMLLISHYLACIWCYIGEYGSDNYESSWINLDEISYNQYISAFYFCFQIMVFDGNMLIQPTNMLEMICLFVFKLIAIFHLFYAIIKIVYILTDTYRKQKETRDELRDLQEYLQKNNKINPFLKSKITTIWQNHLKRLNKNKMQEKFKKISEIIPENIKNAISTNLNDKVPLQNYDIFTQNFSEDTLNKLPKYFIKKKYYENQEIFTKGKLDDKSLFMIVKGKALIHFPIKEEKMKIKKDHEIIGF